MMNDNDEPKQIDGVCCQYCINFEQPLCPVKTASPWSRWGNWCNAYHPNPNMPDARPLPDAKEPCQEIKDEICSEILEIMAEWHRQMGSKGYVSTPGGFEHLGDVWRKFLNWEERLKVPELTEIKP
jgi:hypothetical protein